ncbi:MAG TPA: hypothetical protein VFT59_00950 [Candidatus Saccharimonadales bacterium]|nr:hypothetical protein [Candidatus Saccharimonadales bacterium]
MAESNSLEAFLASQERQREQREERLQRAQEVQDTPPASKPEPSKVGKFIRWALVALVVLGVPSAVALVLHNTLEGDNDPTKMDFVQALEGIGIGGAVLTVLVILVMAFFIFDD